MNARFLRTIFLTLLAVSFFSLASAQAPVSGILTRDQAGPILPQTVFYRGQTAPIQARNSGGYRTADGKLILLALVDNSGYASSIQQTYQAYLITEVTLKVGDKTLPPGAYGFGFVAGNRMVVMDVGANEVLTTTVTPDAAMLRPNPLQILADPTSKSAFRLYLGRNFVAVNVGLK